MKTLDVKFRAAGFEFQQLRRDGRVALYEKRKAKYGFDSYEVVVVQVHPAGNRFGKDYPDREGMPPSSLWGRRGWTYSNLGAAENKFEEVAQSLQDAQNLSRDASVGAS